MLISRRILKEIRRPHENPLDDIHLEPAPDNHRHLKVKFYRPKDSPYEGGIFNSELFLP